MRVTIEVEKFNGTTTYEFDPLSIVGPMDMSPGERRIIATVLRVVADVVEEEPNEQART